jgi:hypothetical protein
MSWIRTTTTTTTKTINIVISILRDSSFLTKTTITTKTPTQ